MTVRDILDQLADLGIRFGGGATTSDPPVVAPARAESVAAPTDVWVVVRNSGSNLDGICRVYSTEEEAYEDLDVRTERGVRPDLQRLYHVEKWKVAVTPASGEPAPDRLAQLLIGPPMPPRIPPSQDKKSGPPPSVRRGDLFEASKLLRGARLDPDPLEPTDVDMAYAEGFVDGQDAANDGRERSQRQLLGAIGALTAITAIALFLLGFATGRVSAAPRPPAQPGSGSPALELATGAPTARALVGVSTGAAAVPPAAAAPTSGTVDPLCSPQPCPTPTPAPTPRPTDRPAAYLVRSGIASTVGDQFGDRYLALPDGPGIRVRICGQAGCVVRVSTDAGPDLAMQRAGRVCDLSGADFEAVSGLSWRRYGLTSVTVTVLGRG